MCRIKNGGLPRNTERHRRLGLPQLQKADPNQSPRQLTRIGRDAFQYCSFYNSETDTYLTHEDLGKTYLDGWVIEGKDGIDILEGTRGIADRVFWGQASLYRIDIPASLRYIGEGIAADCKTLKELRVSEDNPYYKMVITDTIGHCVIDTRTSTLMLGCGERIDLTRPDTPQTLHIAPLAFSGQQLIGAEYLKLPKELLTIGKFSFYNAGVRELYIGDALTFIDTGAFVGTSFLHTIYYDGTIAEWEAIEKADGWVNNNLPAFSIICTDGEIPRN